MEVLQNSRKFRVGTRCCTRTRTRTRVFLQGLPVPRVLCHGRTELTQVPGTGMNVVQNLQQFRARVTLRVWFCAYPTEHNIVTNRNSGDGYESLTELTEVPGRLVYECSCISNRTRTRVFLQGHIPVPRALCHGLTALTEVPGTGMNVVQNLQNFRYG